MPQSTHDKTMRDGPQNDNEFAQRGAVSGKTQSESLRSRLRKAQARPELQDASFGSECDAMQHGLNPTHNTGAWVTHKAPGPAGFCFGVRFRAGRRALGYKGEPPSPADSAWTGSRAARLPRRGMDDDSIRMIRE